ncbi:hypothetical protein MPH_02353 [Macrophomina phaseolina MS6]|uniref:Transcription factor fungi n=1 Tax=Macrophomina phaseolina (strain MS6) TaxID=1126212 RepID=K2SD62_MACPH|nr:hypothetical protein MPH_02353 [Macrophomina phaseolina MS6]
MMSLSRIYEKIMTNLYAPKPLLRGPQKIPFLSSCILELKTWFYDLPPEMRIDRAFRNPVCPQVYTTHMVYHTSYIILMQPFLVRPRNSSQTTAAAARPENHAITKKADAICYEASRQLVLVARKYRQAYGSFRKSPITATHCTLSAALVLLRLARQNNDGGDSAKTISAKDIRMIEDCLQVLKELSTAWNIAKKIRDSLVKLYQQLRSASEDVGQSSGLGWPNTDSGSSATSDPLLATQMLAAEQAEAFPQAFSGDSAPGVPESMSLADFSEEMLFDDSLWVNTGLDPTLDSLTSDYNSFDILGQW